MAKSGKRLVACEDRYANSLPMAPTHCFFSVSGNSLEYLIGISPEIMAYGYHRGINECYAGTPSERSQIKEEHELEEHAAFQLHEAVI